MNEIDWSKAPAGATHWEPNNEYANQGWMKFKNGIWSFMGCEGIWRQHSSDMEAGRLAVMIPRPAEPAGWDGDGIPPVGTVCYCVSHERDVEILQIGMNRPYLSAACRALDNNDLFWAGEFLPIRTPEQIAAEERERAIQKMWFSVRTVDADHIKIQKQVCADLYDAGYRRTES